jgi:Asp/Glu/hydantoin racemase
MNLATARPRIGLIHALAQSQPPVLAAFARLWPEAQPFNLLDDSLAPDLAVAGKLDEAMCDRFIALARYAAGTEDTAGILFTCSAFGPAIDRVKRALSIPVLKPNEAAFELALSAGKTIGLVVTFRSSLNPMLAEFRAMAQSTGSSVRIEGSVAEGALDALVGGDAARHDALIADAAAAMKSDVIVLGQFSMARAASIVTGKTGLTVYTTPESAVAKIRSLVRR